MRIDKYLWAIRIYKTRSLSSAQVKEGKVSLNDSLVKPSREVKSGDLINLRKGAVHFQYKVLELPKSRVGAKLVPIHMEDLTPQSELDKLELIRLQRIERPYGTGRPTKQERRDWEKYFGHYEEDDDEGE